MKKRKGGIGLKKKILSMLLSAAMVMTMLSGFAVSAADDSIEPDPSLGTNIALKATAGASYSNPYGGVTPAAMNDGKYATSDTSTTWNSWGEDEANYPVKPKLTWDKEYQITGMRVIWWADNAEKTAAANVTFPKSCQVKYLDAEGNYQVITGMTNEKGAATDEVGVEIDSSSNNGIEGNNKYWNYVKFPEPITTKELQLEVERSGSGTNGVGIGEWEVYGIAPVGSGENVAPNATAKASYTNTTIPSDAAKNVNDKNLADGNNTSWNTWSKDGNVKYPVTMDLDWGEDEYEVSSLRVMWWRSEDNGVLFPKNCGLQYYNSRSKQWVDITDLVDETGADVTSVGVKFGTADKADTNADNYKLGANRYWNGVSLKTPVKTKKLRLVIDRNGEGSTGVGIGEIEVYGNKQEKGTGENVAKQATASADAQNTPVTNVNNGSLATDAGTSWNTWNSSTYPTYVALTWDTPYELNGMRVMYWADNGTLTASGNVTFPKSCEVEYYDHNTGAWTPITAMKDESGADVASVGVKYGSAAAADLSNPGNYLNGNNRYWNAVTFNDSVKTTALRLKIDRNGSGANGVGIGEWEVFGEKMTAEWNELVAAQIVGKDRIQKGEAGTYTADSLPSGLEGMTYKWEVSEESKDVMEISGSSTEEQVKIQTKNAGRGILKLTVSHVEDGKTVARNTQMEIKVDGVEGIDTYVTATAAGKAPILPKTVVANGITFDDPTPDYYSWTKPEFNFAESFDSKLVPVEWEEVKPELYAEGQEGNTFEVKGTVKIGNETFDAKAEVTVKKEVVAPEANSTVTFENVQLTDNFWNPKQKVNAINSLNKAIYQIEQASGGEPNFVNSIKKLNGEPYDEFQGFVFQDSDIYKSIEAISYTLSVIHDDTDPEIVAQREKLEEKLAYWISLIEQVQYADGYIDTHFTLRSTAHAGGGTPGIHRWRDFSNHEMYNAGHFLEGVVAYTRYREGIGEPDYSLYIVGRRFADEIVGLFGPEGTRHEVPGHEEIELALVKFAKLVEEYEGEGTGQKYIDTAKIFIDRRGEDQTLRESGYKGNDYSQDFEPIKTEKDGVGHAVRACYFYAGVTDVATLLPEGNEDRAAYLATMDNIWDSVANRKTYITGGIGVASHGEDFGGDYELPNNGSYCEVCASIALANWNQRMNLIHEDAKYADVVERTLYNAILVGTNLEGNKFYYSSLLEVANGNPRSDWFACACCPPNLMRTIAKLSEYMYTVHGDDLFVNQYIGSNGSVNVDGTKVGVVQETNYPWEGTVKMTVNPAADKAFTMKIRIPGWVAEQANTDVAISVNGKAVTAEAENGYVSINRTWKKGDVVMIDMPMEIRKTEANPNVTTNAGRIALERGPVVYCMEKAGNAQINNDNIFNPLNYVIPRDAELTAEYNEELLNGVVEITGDVLYNNNGTLQDAKLQAVPYYAWNNRGDNGVQGQNSSSKMLIWTKADGASVSVGDTRKVALDATANITAKVAGAAADSYAWEIKDGDCIEIVSGADAQTVVVKGVKEGTATLEVTVTAGGETMTAECEVTVKKEVVMKGIKVTAPTKTKYTQGEALDLSGMKVTAQYDDGTEEEISAEDCQVSGYDPSKTGKQTVTVSYMGQEATFTVTVDKADEPGLPYKDVEKGTWYYDAIAYNYYAKTMTGLRPDHFGPADTLVRAQFAAVLHKMNEEVEVEYTDKFADVTKDDWFKNPVLWAAEKEIVTGYTGTDMFGPNDVVTREQMATMMYRYAKNFKKYEVSADGDCSKFPDAESIQPFAQEAMKWAVKEEIITGKTINGQLLLDPQGSANRAECATIIQRFLEKYGK